MIEQDFALPTFQEKTQLIALDNIIKEEAEKQRACAEDEKIVSLKESAELQAKGAVVVAMFVKDGQKVHKVKIKTEKVKK